MPEENQSIEQVIENDTIMKVRLGGYLQLLLTLFIVWLFYNTYSSYSLMIDRGTLIRIHEATGATELYDRDANGWVRIQRSGLVYIVNEDTAKGE